MVKYDNPIFNTLNKIADCAFLCLLWFVFSLPVVTVGAASTALYYTVVKVIRKENGHVFPEFFSYFKENFKQSTVLWLIYAGVLALLGLSLWGAYALAKVSSIMGVVTIVLLVLLNLAVLAAMLTLSYSARFVFPTGQIIKNALLIFLMNIGWNLLLWIILFAACLLFLYIPVAAILFPAPICLIMSYIYERIFKKYMSPEDYAQELEQTRTYYN